MSTEKKHPKWWQLYVMLPVLVSLFYPETRAALTETGHIIAEVGILFLIFGFVQLWLRANRSALMNLDPAEAGWRISLHEVPAEQLRAVEEMKKSPHPDRTPERPGREIRGVLGDAFEWDLPEVDSSVFADPRAVTRKE
jgi:hypothetical protein